MWRDKAVGGGGRVGEYLSVLEYRFWNPRREKKGIWFLKSEPLDCEGAGTPLTFGGQAAGLSAPLFYILNWEYFFNTNYFVNFIIEILEQHYYKDLKKVLSEKQW